MTDGLGLGDVYGATIERIRAQGGHKSRLGMGALMWISYAEVPLSPDELCHALAIELGSTDFNASNVPSIMTLVSCCQGLITVDKEASTVRLIHFTLREYLSAHPDIFSRPHSTIAEICLTYLNSKQVKAFIANYRGTVYTHIGRNPFLEYCSRYWGVHAKKELSDCARSLALQLFSEYDGLVSGILPLMTMMDFTPVDRRDKNRFLINGLHWASFVGIAEVVAALIGMKYYDLNEGDSGGLPPLSWAAAKGNEEVVKILIGQEEVNPDKPDNIGRTPLWHAVQYGREGVVKILLGREEVNPNTEDKFGITPLLDATVRGYEGTVKILLGREEVNPDKPGDDGTTLLSRAAENGHEGVVKILLAQEEVNPDKPDRSGRTPLSFAASVGREGVVKILLGHGEVNPDKPDRDGRTPLSYAAEYGWCEGVVKILLAQE